MSDRLPLKVQIATVDREIAMRRAVYPKRVASGAMKAADADRHIAEMEAVRNTLAWVQKHESALRALASKAETAT